MFWAPRCRMEVLGACILTRTAMGRRRRAGVHGSAARHQACLQRVELVAATNVTGAPKTAAERYTEEEEKEEEKEGRAGKEGREEAKVEREERAR